MSARKPSYAGLRRWYPNPITGGHVGLYDGVESGDDTDAGRWQTVCEVHGSINSHETFELARGWAPHPAEWCEDCAKLVEIKTMTDAGLAAGLADAEVFGSPEKVAFYTNEIVVRLGLSLDETEQGLTDEASLVVTEWVEAHS